MACCSLHDLFAKNNFAEIIHYEAIPSLAELCCRHATRHQRKQADLTNLNSINVEVYLFRGNTQRHLASLTKQYFAIQPISEEINKTRPWYPVMTMDMVYVTKSLAYLTHCPLPQALLYILSYFENKFDAKFVDIVSNLKSTMEIPMLFYLMHHSSSKALINSISRYVGLKLKCDISTDVEDTIPYLTDDINESISKYKNKTFFSYMPQCLQPLHKKIDEEELQKKEISEWTSPISHFLLTRTWNTHHHHQNQMQIPNIIHYQEPANTSPLKRQLQPTYSSTSHPHTNPLNTPTTSRNHPDAVSTSSISNIVTTSISATDTTTAKSMVSNTKGFHAVPTTNTATVSTTSANSSSLQDSNIGTFDDAPHSKRNDTSNSSTESITEIPTSHSVKRRNKSNVPASHTVKRKQSLIPSNVTMVKRKRGRPRKERMDTVKLLNQYSQEKEQFVVNFKSLTYFEFKNITEKTIKSCKKYIHYNKSVKFEKCYFYTLRACETLTNYITTSNILVQYILVPGLYRSILFTMRPLNDSFVYLSLIKSTCRSVSFETAANLAMCHLRENRMPFFINLTPVYLSYYFLKLLKFVENENEFEMVKIFINNLITS